MAAWTAAARQAINIGRLSSLKPASLVHRRGFSDHHGPPKVNIWQEPLSPSKWKEEQFVAASMTAWMVLLYGSYKFFNGGKDKKEEKPKTNVPNRGKYNRGKYNKHKRSKPFVWSEQKKQEHLTQEVGESSKT